MTLTSLTNSSYTSFLTTFFVNYITYFFFKSTGTVANLSTSNSSTLLFTLFKPFNSSASNSSTVVLKLTKSASWANVYVSTLVAIFKSDFVAKFDKSNSTFISF